VVGECAVARISKSLTDALKHLSKKRPGSRHMILPILAAGVEGCTSAEGRFTRFTSALARLGASALALVVPTMRRIVPYMPGALARR
jgi:hypothetical protein